MKHAKRTRPENTAGKSSNQTQKIPIEMTPFGRQAGLVLETLDKEIERGHGQETAARLWCLRQQMVCLLKMGFEMEGISPGAAGKPATAAHDELMKACHEASDLMYMMGLPLAALMEGTPGDGTGVQALAEHAGLRLMECLSAALEENRLNGGGR